MRANEYQKWCRRFDNHRSGLEPRMVSTALALGLCAEAGEVANEYERSRREGGRLDPVKVADELGDVLWNVARLADELGYSLENLFESNINKLLARYQERGIPLNGDAA